MTYLLQVQTEDFGLQLKTECVADTIEGLLYEAKEMVKKNSVVKGMKYRIFRYAERNGNFNSEFLKENTISK